MSFITVIAAAFTTIAAIIIANYNATLLLLLLLLLPLLALLANFACAIIALFCLFPLYIPILQTSCTINYTWLANLKAKLSYITS